MVPINNKKEEDKTYLSFWISRQWYVTTSRNVVKQPPTKSTFNQKGTISFCNLYSQKLKDSYTKISTPLARKENFTPFRMFPPPLFFFVQMDYLYPKVTWIYTTWKSIFFNIYIYIYDSDWHRRQKKQAMSTLFPHLRNARQCFSGAIGKQYLVCTHLGVLEHTW